MHFDDLKRILYPLVKEKLLVIYSVLVGVIAAGLNLSRPLLIGAIIGELVGGSPASSRFVWLVSFFVVSWVMTWFVSITIRYLSTAMNQKILMHLRISVLQHFMKLPPVESEQLGPGRIESHSTSDLPVWSNLYGSVLAEVVHSLAQLIGAIIALSHLDSRLTLLIAPFLLLSFFIPFLTTRFMMKLNRNVQDAISGVLENLSDIIHGLRDIISFRAENWGLKRYRKACETSYHAEVKRNVAQSILQIASASTEVISYVLALVIGGRLVMRNELDVGALVSFLATIEMIFFPARYANDLFGTILNSFAAAKRVWEFLDSGEERSALPKFNELQLRSVDFKYPGSTKNVLEDINCHIKKGELVTVIGESGSGKSTLLNIIAGLYRHTSGDIKHLGDKVASTSCVWQEPFLYNCSVYDNLTLDMDLSLEKVRKTASNINIDNVVMGLSNFYESNVRSSGNNFSGGERRRLAIVRALLQNPGFLVLDEPTAGLDVENAGIVWKAIENCGPQVTRVVSTHRMEEAKKADLIIVVQDGKLIECGCHHDLMLTNGIYKRMIRQSNINYS